MPNPFRSEDAMFRGLLWTIAAAAVIVGVVELIRALT
jgi:hypothetical protein